MSKGFVALVGAGPGSVGLLTVRALEYIKKADVVVYDRLVSEDILKLIPHNTELINVGKQSNMHLVPQDGINRILLEQAQLGKLVVRLKGGDPFVFGRGGEELELLCQHNIDFEVVPGITAAIAVPTYAGIPVSHRDFCSSIHFITGHQKENEPLDIDFRALVNTKGTLIFFMGLASLPQIAAGLLSAGMDKNMPAAVIENGTRNNQRKVLATLSTLPQMAVAQQVKSPALIIVGKVCQLSEQYDWFGKRLLSGCELIVTRPHASEGTLVSGLRELGALVHDCPCINIEAIKDNQALQQALTQLEQYNWLLFTSKNGVQIFFEALRASKLDTRALGGKKIAAVGTQTAQALQEYGVVADYIPAVFDGEHLGQGVAELSKAQDKILLLRARIGSERIVEVLEQAGRSVEDIAVYDTVYRTEQAEQLRTLLSQGEDIYITFTSASTVEGFMQAVGQIPNKELTAICIGQQTAQAANKYKFKTIISAQATIGSMIDKIKEVHHANQTAQA